MKTAIRNGFRVYFERHYKLVFGNLLNRTGNPAEAEDLTQETFLRAAKYHRQQGQHPPLTWLVTVAGNVYKNWVRYRTADKRDATEKTLEDIPEIPSGDHGCQEQKLLVKQQIHALNNTIHMMPVQMRRCFTLFYLQEYKYHEIAVLLNINIQTVRSQLNRGRKKVVESLKELHL